MPSTVRRLLAVGALLGLVAGCGGNAASTGTPVPDGELRIAAQFAPRSGYAMDTDDAFVVANLGSSETLVKAGSDGTAQPSLATSWTQDGARWTFTLRPGVTFHDGTPLTPAAVVDSLTWVAGVSAPPRAIRGIGLTAAESGPDAVTVTTAKPDPILPLRLSSVNTAILAPSAYTGGPPNVVGTGTGPMRIVSAQGTQEAVVERNDAYWGPRPQLARATVQFVTDPAARALALRAGDVQIAQGLPESSLLEFTEGNGYTNQSVAAPRTVSLMLNESRAPFDDIRVRQAVAKAIDRTALAEQALAGSALPASELFGPAVAWGSQDPPPAPDVQGAKDLLAAAGNPQISVTLATYPNRPELPTLATAVQGMLREIGVDARIQIGEYGPQEPGLLAGDYDMFLLSRNYLTDVPDAGSTLVSDYSCAGSYNINRYCSPEFDALLAPLGTTSDPAERQRIFTAAAAKLDADAVGLPLVHSQENAVGRDVAGYTIDPLAKQLLTTEVTRTE
ncbi:ABC transporter substrate-binding protein [Pseudonocardia oroxyli]|uniref:Peptide/nickel transport system substrate-binding protein n=1 Tax=Pseudonocardia oroxyli TaxID=366584 RepID=A0A1G7L9B5_PSEOR|nr:ABC transporter substrate-binding protein [Pseudonocardia oroxyli]SDF46142.1 peptide/nickel transport system substrate-binding protein [Pseudonocardia oroxyli]